MINVKIKFQKLATHRPLFLNFCDKRFAVLVVRAFRPGRADSSGQNDCHARTVTSVVLRSFSLLVDRDIPKHVSSLELDSSEKLTFARKR